MPRFPAVVPFVSRSISWIALLLLAAPLAQAQIAGCQPSWDPGFGLLPGVDQRVRAAVVFDDGGGPKLIVAGKFTEAGGGAINHVAKWDGTRWTPLGAGLDGEVHSLVIFDDGSGPALYAAGYFSQVAGVPAQGLARWDGSAWSEAGLGHGLLSTSEIACLAVFDDGSGPALYAGGSIDLPGHASTQGVAKWNGNGWSALGSRVGGWVWCMAVHDEGSGPALYVGGDFWFPSSMGWHHVARWNGTSWSFLGDFDGPVNALCTFDDGSGPALYVGGEFGHANNVQAWNVARWRGGAWSSVGTINNLPDSAVESLAVWDDGTGAALYAGGDVGLYDPSTNENEHVNRWDGTQWSALGRGLDSLDVHVLAPFDDGHGARLYAGGYFTRAGSESLRNIASWDGVQWSGLGPASTGPSAGVDVLRVLDDGHGPALYVGGRFRAVAGQSISSLVRWDGANWSAVGGGFPFDWGSVRALELHDDGAGPALYAAGVFVAAGGVPVHNIARWDGTQWSALGSGVGWAYSLQSFDDGSGAALYVGTDGLAGGLYAAGIARWDGNAWSALGRGLTFAGTIYGRAFALAVFDDGNGPALYAGGEFDLAGTVPASGIAKWDGASWSALSSGLTLASGQAGSALALAVFDDGSGPALYAGGSFDSAGGLGAKGIAKWNGSAWSAVGAGVDGTVRALHPHVVGGRRVLDIGGSFHAVGGVNANHIARWDGTNWVALDEGMAMPVGALCDFDDGSCNGTQLYAGGAPTFDDSAGTFLGRWGCKQECTTTLCFGDGSSAGQLACPCANAGAAGRGCDNSAASGGAELASSGLAQNDTLVLTSSGETANALSIFLQGDALQTSGAHFGDGVRCVAGTLKRLYMKSAAGALVSAPAGADASIRAQSASLGDPIAHGTTRWYQVWYRDPSASFCPAPQGGTFNVTNALEVRW